MLSFFKKLLNRPKAGGEVPPAEEKVAPNIRDFVQKLLDNIMYYPEEWKYRYNRYSSGYYQDNTERNIILRFECCLGEQWVTIENPPGPISLSVDESALILAAFKIIADEAHKRKQCEQINILLTRLSDAQKN